MSKIYEALLRAESERAGSTDQGGSVATLQDLLPTAEVSSSFRDEPEPPSSFGSEALAGLDQSPAPLQPVPRRWKPIIAALPALEERGQAVEQFRSLRSHVIEFREQRPLKSLLVSSGLPGEGKSYIALNLALSFSRHKGNRVLLIDADMRRSSLDRILGAPKEPGLTEYLSGQASLEEVLQQPENQDGKLPPGLGALSFIAGGRDADRAGDLAASTQFVELMQRITPLFDWIILDSSPVNLVSDAVNLSRACDGVLLVSREGVTRFKTAQQAQAQFKTTQILGFVLNAVHSMPKADYYGGYESYSTEVPRG